MTHLTPYPCESDTSHNPSTSWDCFQVRRPLPGYRAQGEGTWPAFVTEGSMREGNDSHPAALENRQTVFHWEAQVVFGSQVPPEESVQDVGCHPVCTPCPEGMSIKRKTWRQAQKILLENVQVQTKPRPCRELGPITGTGTTYHYHTVLLPRSSLNAPHVTAQMAPGNDIQLLMLVKQTAKHHGLGASTVHATHRAVTPTYCTGYLLLHRKQPHYIL